MEVTGHNLDFLTLHEEVQQQIKTQERYSEIKVYIRRIAANAKNIWETKTTEMKCV